ncbi:RagB/SusD family nutrient uptake outer membrane protein [Mucilaginibacter daejeonensis]|uniref:RagB/SusD family nutrient uptake outer membrane protein n=1 Tax=Mucilaginibacter daejeonensis TaxID=398049 RepID=UPI001D174B9C|nr:RagB/SusD family nutrient uptake outer membrane protein [Mucilaginibacter daejeonensis]UEG54996.1 RagB/SusD family nutrient uptake outer membrane protein [Mucilaginibacter daejeonensis]
MFKKLIFQTLLIASLTVSVSSCNKYLELRPQDGITRDKFWQSKEQIKSAVIGCYIAMQVPFGGRPAPAESFFVWGELRADMIAPGLGMGVDELNVVNATILSTNGVTDWRNFYRVINFCNTIIDFAPGVKDVDATLTDTELRGYLAEALTIRALMYFYLVRSFGDVPLKLKSTSSDSELVQLAKTPQPDVLKQIVADLKLAETYATTTYGDNASDKGRVTIYTVYAMEADVYLWMDNYNECIAATDKIINSNKFGLVAGNNNSWFNILYGVGNSAESIFELQFDQQSLNPYFTMFSTNRRRYLAGPNTLDEVFGVDLVNDINFDLRGIDASIRPDDQSIYKYIGLTPDVARTQDVSYAHWIFYRYADILLLKAEACAQIGRGQDALTIINTLRTRAHAITVSAESPSPEDVAGVTNYVLRERARELAYEGKRWYDLLRNAKRNNYARLDLLTAAAIRSVPGTVQQSALNKLKDKNSHYFPIFQYEIQTDPNLIQNPFYK